MEFVADRHLCNYLALGFTDFVNYPLFDENSHPDFLFIRGD